MGPTTKTVWRLSAMCVSVCVVCVRAQAYKDQAMTMRDHGVPITCLGVQCHFSHHPVPELLKVGTPYGVSACTAILHEAEKKKQIKKKKR